MADHALRSPLYEHAEVRELVKRAIELVDIGGSVAVHRSRMPSLVTRSPTRASRYSARQVPQYTRPRAEAHPRAGRRARRWTRTVPPRYESGGDATALIDDAIQTQPVFGALAPDGQRTESARRPELVIDLG